MSTRGLRRTTREVVDHGVASRAPDPLASVAVAINRVGRPSVADHVVLRTGVLDSLSSALGSVVVVGAPAGFGKTSHVAAWAEIDGRPTAWLEVEALDNDPHLLVERLADLLGSVTDFDADSIPRSPLSTAQFETIIAPAIGSAVRRCAEPFVLVIDEIHRLESEVALSVVAAILNDVPPDSTVVIIGRDAPGASIAALRLRPEVATLDVTDLALEAAEARAVLEEIGVSIGDDDLGRVLDETEGWPLGVRFAGFATERAAAAGGQPDVIGALADREIGEYMRFEWLRRLDADDVDFLTRSSGLGWLSGPLVDHALERNDSGATLARLASSPLVIVPLDRRGSTHRLHHLMAEVLDAEFERADRDAHRSVAIRASEWFERSGDIDRAIDHASRVGDTGRIVRLIAEHGLAMQTVGRHHSVDRWLAMLPRDVVLSSGALCLLSATISVAMGEGDEALVWLKFADQAVADAGQPGPAGLEIRALRSMLVTSDIDGTSDDAEAAYENLPAGRSHALACLSRGLLSFVRGDDALARTSFEEGVIEARLVNASTLEAQCNGALGLLHAVSGDWTLATATARRARQVVTEHALEQVPTLVVCTATSAWVEAHAGNPEAARADILLTRRNLAYLDKVTSWLSITARVALAEASLLLGDQVGTKMFLDDVTAALDTLPRTGRIRDLVANAASRLTTAHLTQHGPSALTTAQLRVLHYLPTNLSMAEIGERLFVSRNTAKTHASAIYLKLEAASRREAVEAARRAGLLPPG